MTKKYTTIEKDFLGIEIQEEIRGMYRPSFMQMYLNFHYDGNFDNLTLQDKGTFIHEYIHFLQNVSTPYGLYQSMFFYSKMLESYKVIKSFKTIKLPLRLDKNVELIQRDTILKLGMGDNPLLWEKNIKVDMDKNIISRRSLCTIDGKKYPKIETSLSFIDGTQISFTLGSQIIKESMASMYQRIIDPNVNRNDLPYNFVELFCKQKYPNIADDKKKLISICYISLFSRFPSELLMTELQYANEHLEKNGKELFNDFVNNESIILPNNRKMNVVDFFDDIINKFKNILEKCLINAQLDYLDAVLERVRLSHNFVPIISVLYDEGTNLLDCFPILKDYFGTPYIYTPYGEYLFPESTFNKGDSSNEIMALIGFQALFHILFEKFVNCPLYIICQGTKMEKAECFEHKPWEGNDCAISIMAKTIGLDKVKILN